MQSRQKSVARRDLLWQKRTYLDNNAAPFVGVVRVHSPFWIGALLEMNPPSPLSSSDDTADFGDLIDDADPAEPGKREGLPASFRMRNAHYVDQLETPPRPALKLLAVATIETETVRDVP